MEDHKIIDLYWARCEDAIAETKAKYGAYCASIAERILFSAEDSEECVSDACLRVWNSVPPNRPENLKAYIGKITRNLALNRLRDTAAKRRGEVPLVFEELSLADPRTAETETDGRLLSEAVTAFLRTLRPGKRRIFVLRYWYFESLSEISGETGIPESRLKGELFRLRKKLAAYLEKEGFSL